MNSANLVKIFFFFLLIGPLNGQNQTDSFYLKEIEFLGLSKTKEAYLRNILQAKINQLITIEDINADLQILKNFSGFSDAHYEIDSIGQNIHLTYLLEERITALPIINFGGIKNNIWFSLGIIENNFRGYGDLLLAYYLNNNGRHSGEVYFKKRSLLHSNWGYSFSLNKWSSDEPVFFDEGTVEYQYDNNGLGLSLIRNFDVDQQIELGGTYFVESYNKTNNQILENPPGPDEFSIKKFLTKLIFSQSFLDYHLFYLKGFESVLIYQNVLNIEERSLFNSVQLENKLFLRPHKKLNLAFRTRLAISTNIDSPFAPFVADSHVNIRGIGNKIDRGTAQLVLNAESRYTVYHKNYWSSQFVLFADAGTWRNPGGKLGDIFDSSVFRQFVGGGIRINFQKIFGATLRIDYGIDIFDTNQRGLVIGLGQYY